MSSPRWQTNTVPLPGSIQLRSMSEAAGTLDMFDLVCSADSALRRRGATRYARATVDSYPDSWRGWWTTQHHGVLHGESPLYDLAGSPVGDP